MLVSRCYFHPEVESVGVCPKCGKSLCGFCLPSTDKRCRACVGYGHAKVTAAAAATTVSLFVGLINPFLGLIMIVILFLSFRALFRHRTRVVLRSARPATVVQSNMPKSVERHYCNDCHLWNEGPSCVQCGNKLVH